MQELQNFFRKKKHKALSTELSPRAEDAAACPLQAERTATGREGSGKIVLQFKQCRLRCGVNDFSWYLGKNLYLVTHWQYWGSVFWCTQAYGWGFFFLLIQHYSLQLVRVKYENPLFSFCTKVVSRIITARRNYDSEAIFPSPPKLK